MERLTIRRDGHPALAQGYEERFTEQSIAYMLTARLATYEDTGLTPEEIVGLCSMSERAKMADLLNLEEYQTLCSIEYLRELAQAEKDGRLVVLPDVKERDRKSFVNGLQDYFQEASFYDPSTGIFGMSEGEKELASALMNALTCEEAEAALEKRREDDEAD